jgi:hypothetical protein
MADDDLNFPLLPSIPKLPRLERLTDAAEGINHQPKRQQNRFEFYCQIKKEHSGDGEIQIIGNNVMCPFFKSKIHNDKEFQNNVCECNYEFYLPNGFFGYNIFTRLLYL